MPLKAYAPTPRADELKAVAHLKMLGGPAALALVRAGCPTHWIRRCMVQRAESFAYDRGPFAMPDYRRGSPPGSAMPATAVLYNLPPFAGAPQGRQGHVLITFVDGDFKVLPAAVYARPGTV